MSHHVRIKLREYLAISQNWKCHWCNQSMISAYGFQDSTTIEHIIPRSQGGTNYEINLKAACYRCNNVRGAEDVITFAGRARDFPIDSRSLDEATKTKCKQPTVIRVREDSRIARQAVLDGIDNPFEEGSRWYQLYESHKIRLETKGQLDPYNIPAEEVTFRPHEIHNILPYDIDFHGLEFYVLLILSCKFRELSSAMAAPVENRITNHDRKYEFNEFNKSTPPGPSLS